MAINTNNAQWGNLQSDDVKGLNDIYRWLKKLETTLITTGLPIGGGWTDSGSSVSLTTATDTVQIQSQLTIGGNSTAQGKLILLEDSDNGAHSITIQPPASLAASYSLTFPSDDGNANGRLTSDGSGVLTWSAEPEILIISCSDESTAITTGTAKVTFRMPFAMNLSSVRASVTTAPTGSTLVIDINENTGSGATSILSTKLSIDISEKTSTTAATPPVLSDTALADDSEITIDFDQVGSTIAGTGVKVYLIGTRA